MSLALAGCGGGGGGGGGSTTSNPKPSVSAITPAIATVGDPDFTLTVDGSSFVSGSIVRWNGLNQTTTFVGSTRLTATIQGDSLLSGGTVSVTVYNPAPGGGSSNSMDFTLNNPAPTITSISPTLAYAGALDFTLTVNGTGFVTRSKLQWNGADRLTFPSSRTQISATIPASDIASVGSGEVTIFNPPPGGGTSAPITFPITLAPPLEIRTSQLPSTTGGHDYSFTLDIEGAWLTTGFPCSILAGALPAGLTFATNSCRIRGMAEPVSTDTTFNFTVFVTNHSIPVRTGTKDLSIKVFSAGNLGRNDACTGATMISNGRIRASISPYGDVDIYSFHGTAGKEVTIEILAQWGLDTNDLPFFSSYTPSQLDSMLELLDDSCPDPQPDGMNALAFSDDQWDPDTLINDLDSRIPSSHDSPGFTLPYTGTYFIRVRDFRGDGRPDLIYELRLTGAD